MTVGRTSPGRSSDGLRILNAGNRGLFTLDGTRTHLVGHREVAVIDPGPHDPIHVAVLIDELRDASRVRVLLTHGHDDHAGAARPLAEALGCDVLGPGDTGTRPLRDAGLVPTDAGDLVAISTPGHAEQHLCYSWPARSAVFVGDLLLGEGDTTWVAGYSGCVEDYLDSLRRVQALAPEMLYPAHGPPLDRPNEAIERFRAHRLHRIDQVVRGLRETPGADAGALVDRIYGPSLPAGMVRAAVASVEALIEYAKAHD